MSTDRPFPKRSEIWLVDLNPTRGAEINKTRPALVISSDAVGKLPLKLVAPITGWDDRYSNNFWHIKIDPNASNGLDKPSAIDALQIRSVSIDRFVERKGIVTATIIEEVTNAVTGIIEHV